MGKTGNSTHRATQETTSQPKRSSAMTYFRKWLCICG